MIPISSVLRLSFLLCLCKTQSTSAFSSTTTTTTPATDEVPRGGRETESVDVAIVGAGPSGLALAHCLIDRGYRVRVLERRSSFQPVGSAVFLHPFALNSLQNLSPNLAANVRKASTEVGTVTVKSTTNLKNKATFDNFDLATGIYGNPFVTIKFWDLLQSLRLGLPENIFRFGSDVQGYRKLIDGRVELLYSSDDNTNKNKDLEAIDARMIIDAGGIRSKIRKQMLPKSRPRPFCKAYMTVLPAERADRIVSQHDNTTDTMTSRELGFLLSDVDAMVLATLKNGDVWWTYLHFDDDLDGSLSKEELMERVEGRFPPFVAELLAQTEAEDRKEITIGDLPVTWKLGDGMVTLLGDSAHAQLPTLGLGCSAAFADIEELCKQIDAEGDLCEKALRRYERRRMPQTAALQTASRFAASGVRFVFGTLK